MSDYFTFQTTNISIHYRLLQTYNKSYKTVSKLANLLQLLGSRMYYCVVNKPILIVTEFPNNLLFPIADPIIGTTLHYTNLKLTRSQAKRLPQTANCQTDVVKYYLPTNQY